MLTYLTWPVKVRSLLLARVILAVKTESYRALPVHEAASIMTMPEPSSPPHVWFERYSGLLSVALKTANMELEFARFTAPPIFTVSDAMESLAEYDEFPDIFKFPPIETSENIGFVEAALPIWTSTAPFLYIALCSSVRRDASKAASPAIASFAPVPATNLNPPHVAVLKLE